MRAKYHSLLNEIDKQLTEPEGVGKWNTVAICNEIKEKFRKDTMFEALSEVTGVQQQICLVILKLIFPNFSESIWSISDEQVTRLNRPEDVMTYVDAFIESGLAAETERGVVFVMGNTGKVVFFCILTYQRF